MEIAFNRNVCIVYVVVKNLSAFQFDLKIWNARERPKKWREQEKLLHLSHPTSVKQFVIFRCVSVCVCDVWVIRVELSYRFER